MTHTITDRLIRHRSRLSRAVRLRPWRTLARTLTLSLILVCALAPII